MATREINPDEPDAAATVRLLGWIVKYGIPTSEWLCCERVDEPVTAAQAWARVAARHPGAACVATDPIVEDPRDEG